MSAERPYTEVVITREVAPGVVEVNKKTYKKGADGVERPVQQHTWLVSPVHGITVGGVPSDVGGLE